MLRIGDYNSIIHNGYCDNPFDNLNSDTDSNIACDTDYKIDYDTVSNIDCDTASNIDSDTNPDIDFDAEKRKINIIKFTNPPRIDEQKIKDILNK